MEELETDGTVTLNELIISSVISTAALAQLLIEKKIITEAEFMKRFAQTRADYENLVGDLPDDATARIGRKDH